VWGERKGFNCNIVIITFRTYVVSKSIYISHTEVVNHHEVRPILQILILSFSEAYDNRNILFSPLKPFLTPLYSQPTPGKGEGKEKKRESERRTKKEKEGQRGDNNRERG
jgi:hypothetical protein